MGNDYYIYTTVQGDTFDIIALNAYDDEFKAHILMQANPQHVATITFSHGIDLKVPIIEDDPADTLPPWKR
ncbi:tail protein X [Cellulosilyticum sp. I15G10I2]|uniref:tail protein X n=1 Tax=Cellulosilyticum sp. I15G10I2 TaxID=1892843 RepID=UPI00085BD04F|nr:tail protein X [Cellulosilyticum sp. I15G10I2]